MKKFWLWLIPLICVAVISAGIVIGLNVGKNISNKIIFATDIHWNIPSIEIENGDSLIISKNEIVIEPQNCTQKIVFTTNDNEMLSIDPQTGEIIANKAGECELIATINTSETTKKVAKINVVVTSNQNNETNKTIYNIQKTCYLSDNFDILEFETASPYDQCSKPEVISGNDCILIDDSNHDRSKIYVVFLAVGTAEIVVDSPTDTTHFYITIV